jgi:hypothetical protein
MYDQYAEIAAGTENRMSVLLCSAHAAEAWFRAGNTERAEHELRTLLELVRDGQSPHWEAMVRLLQGEMLAARSAWDDAGLALDAAVATFERQESRIELGRALCQRARWQHERGESAAAVEDATRARRIFVDAGAKRDVARLAELESRFATSP